MSIKNHHIKLGIAGEAGSFSEEAGLSYLQKAQIPARLEYLIDMEGVLAAIQANKIDLGILPVVNSRGGLVTTAFEAMGKYQFTWLDQLSLDIQQCLMVRTGTPGTQITKIVSHPQALAQCGNFLAQKFPQAEKIAYQDTALAARDLAENKLAPHCAVIASVKAAQLYVLEIVAKNIQDLHPNLTTFIIVKPRN